MPCAFQSPVPGMAPATYQALEYFSNKGKLMSFVENQCFSFYPQATRTPLGGRFASSYKEPQKLLSL